MAKKSKNTPKISDELLSAFKSHPASALDALMQHIEPENMAAFQAMYSMVEMGVTPEDYAQFYLIYHATGTLHDDTGYDNGEDNDEFILPRRQNYPVKEYKPLENAEDYTLVLKIQMKDVTKPPMWREISIPAHSDFTRLHDAIQAATGLLDCHLWQFGVKAYDDSLCIAPRFDGNAPTHNPDTTPITQFLQQKGDKLEYVYDFGDDWMFSIEVKEVLHTKTEVPQLRKYKSELNALEDMGGIWAYMKIRDVVTNWKDLSAKERKEFAKSIGFNSTKDFEEFIREQMIHPQEVNEDLAEI